MRGTLLVIEDDQTTVQFIQEFLGLEGYDVLHATAPVAIATALTTAVDAILISRTLPGIDVPALIQQLRTAPATAAIPIISMTEDAPYTGPAASLITDYLATPLTLDVLMVTVARWMKKSPDSFSSPEQQEPKTHPYTGVKGRDDKQ